MSYNFWHWQAGRDMAAQKDFDAQIAGLKSERERLLQPPPQHAKEQFALALSASKFNSRLEAVKSAFVKDFYVSKDLRSIICKTVDEFKISLV